MKCHQIAETDAINKDIDVSVVLPCLDESETLASCIREIQRAFEVSNLRGEIIVSDNGSVDGSAAIALAAGAKVVHASPKGYGVALSTGIAAASANLVVMGDADLSYDFGDIPRFVAKLLEGFDLVIGNRFRGGVMPGAMPWSHRWIGNPVLTAIGQVLFRCPVGDFHCGIRGIRKSAFESLRLNRPGMEFASEMIVRAALARLRVTQISTTLRPDGRSRAPHLRSFSDGWRHLRFMLFFCPRWLFLIPGTSLILTGGLLQFALAISGGIELMGMHFGINASLASVMLVMFGYQLIGSGILVQIVGRSAGNLPRSDSIPIVDRFKIEHGLIVGVLLMAVGAALFLTANSQWPAAAIGDLASLLTLRRVIPAVTLLVIGAQTVSLSLLTGAIGILSDRSVPQGGSLAAESIGSATTSADSFDDESKQ